MTMNERDNMQECFKSKEHFFRDALRDNLGASYKDASTMEDVHQGIDIYIDGVPFDLKASNKRKITVFRKTPFKDWYSPLLKSPEVRYAFPIYEIGAGYVGYEVYKKSDIIEHLASSPSFGKFTGDGNEQIWVSIADCPSETIMFGGTK